VLTLGAFTAFLAILAGLFGWHSNEMLVTAAGIGAAVIVLAIVLLYRQIVERDAADQALQNTEARVGGILNSAMDAIITVDDSQRIVLFNAAAEKVFRRPRAAVLGQPLDMLIPERFRHDHRNHIGRFGGTGVTSRRMGEHAVVTGVRADGGEFPLEASISQISENGARFYTVILRDVTERVRADEALRRSREELRELAAVANSVREQEKSRIARELHDELAQALTALKMDLTWVMGRLPAGQQALAEKLVKMQTTLDGTVAATRRIAADLRPLMLDDLGLVPAAEWLVQNFMERTGIACNLGVAPVELELQEPHATAVFRMLQESLTNVARHAQATRVEIALARTDAEVRLSVRDNGRGFSPADPRKPNSYGLMGLRERAYLLGGDITIDSAAGRGTTIQVRLPVGEPALQP
ncbi:MAG: PAS domain-containing sensor histidine kinase, partial [Burkholderiales bacterium]